jgi:hypothetical protein
VTLEVFTLSRSDTSSTTPHKHTISHPDKTTSIITKNKMTITDGSGGEVGEAQRQFAQHARKDEVKKEIFNVDVWCVIFEKVNKLIVHFGL